MKKEIYDTIVGEKDGFVVNVDYDKFLHWNCGDSSLIVLGRGKYLSINILDDNLKIVNNNGMTTHTTEINLDDLSDSLEMYECLFSDVNDGKIVIIKNPLIVDQLELEGAIYTENVFTADTLVNHFCDRIDFNTEIVVPINNLRLLNDMIKHHANLIKFIKHVKINEQSALAVVTHYNAEYEVRKALDKMYRQTTIDDDCEAFVRQCKMDSDIIPTQSLDNLMDLYSKFSENPYEKIAKKHKNDISADEAYMQMYNYLKDQMM